MWQSDPHSPPKQNPNFWALKGLLGCGVLESAFLTPLILSGPWTFISYSNSCGALEATGGLGPVLGKHPPMRTWGRRGDSVNAMPRPPALPVPSAPIPSPPTWLALPGCLFLSASLSAGSLIHSFPVKLFLCSRLPGMTGKVTIID